MSSIFSLNIALSIANEIKIDVYSYFFETINNGKIQDIRFNNIKNLLSTEKNDIIKSITFIFNELKNADIPIVSDFGDINPFNSKGDFIWGIFYGIHSSGNIRDVLKSRKGFILKPCF